MANSILSAFQACRARAVRFATQGSIVLLTGCTPLFAPHPRAIIPPAPTDVFIARDGERLPVRHWDAASPKAIVVGLHGMNDYSNAFAMPGPNFAAHGVSLIAYDQRGFGQAPHPGIWPGSVALRDDLHDFVERARARHPGIPVFVLGESMGGAVLLAAMADGPRPRIAGAILVAPAVWSRNDMPASYRVALWLAAHALPWVDLSGSGLNIWPSDNLSMLRAAYRDPLVQKRTRADAVWGLVNLMDEARRAAGHLHDPPPILILYGAKDQIIPAGPAKAVIAALGARAEVHRYPYGYHMLLRDLDRRTVWNGILAWVDSHVPPRRPVSIPAKGGKP